ncbi:hypothetical protein [Flavivirga spongiicola]|uniref:LTXXQ motif family protein n=1 Tax=Flavivirga spongiicola TaxID=421621 RepID=A0ABU7XYL4_9FLAO|nr:hypothetical protein [Flavivirga sp. MEBiC05379]MDO5980538.1 hypothetical protein [Flavivirga sp. MEBiC05379]
MNLQKTIMSLLFFIITSSAVFAQKDIDSQINDLIKEDNIMLTETDKSLKLSEEQEVKIKEIYRALIVFKNETSKSKKKKGVYKKALTSKLMETMQEKKDLFTPKQLAAYDAYDAK